MIIRIEAEFIGSGFPADADRLCRADVSLALSTQTFPGLFRPKFLVVDGRYAVGTGGVDCCQ